MAANHFMVLRNVLLKATMLLVKHTTTVVHCGVCD